MMKKKLLLIFAIASCLMLLLTITAFADQDPAATRVDVEYIGAGGNAVTRDFELRNAYNTVYDEGNKTVTIEGIREVFKGSFTLSSKKLLTLYFSHSVSAINIKAPSDPESFSGIKKVVFDAYSDIRIVSLKNLNKLEEIVIMGDDISKVVFGPDCVPDTLKRIRIVSTKTNVVFEKDCFANNKLLNTLEIAKCTDLVNVSSFTFGENCFRNTGIKSLVLDDERANYTFSGAGAFSNCSYLENVVLSKQITNVGERAFENCLALKMVYSYGLTGIGKNVFAIDEKTVDSNKLKVYVHTNSSVSIDRKAFEYRKNSGVTLCVLETSTTILDDCNYELHLGIPHEYVLADSVSTCYILYTTDCPCQKVGNAYYKFYTNGSSQYVPKKVVSGPVTEGDVRHSFSAAYKLEYPDGIENYGSILRRCAACGKIDDVEKRADPVLKILGYSVSETGNNSMVLGVRFNYSTLKQYEEINETELDYGFVAVAESKLNGNAPFDENGVLADRALQMSMKNAGYYESTMSISNIGNKTDAKFVFAVYMKRGKEIVYFQGEGETTTPVGVSYSQFKD